MDKDQITGRIAIIGERELALGFRLIGMESTFSMDDSEGAQKFLELYNSGQFTLIMASENIKKHLERRLLDQIEVSTNPLVVFIPMPGGQDEESVGKLAKRILGVEIGS